VDTSAFCVSRSHADSGVGRILKCDRIIRLIFSRFYQADETFIRGAAMSSAALTLFFYVRGNLFDLSYRRSVQDR